MALQSHVSHGLRFRWINGQCFEFRFPNGKTLLTDPFFRWDGPQDQPIYEMSIKEGFSADDLEGADYVFLNHTHGDHILNLQEVYDRFHSTVITHSATAMEVAKAFDIPLTSIYPVDFDSTCYFDGFRMDFYHGTHHAQKATLTQRLEKKDLWYVGERKMPVSTYGSIFNTNFLLTTDAGFRIAFIGGNNDGMLQRLHGNTPNLIIRNKMQSSKHLEGVAETWAQFLEECQAPLMVPMHYETWLNTRPGFAEDIYHKMNEIMEQKGLIGRVAPMERTKWYSLDLSITPVAE